MGKAYVQKPICSAVSRIGGWDQDLKKPYYPGLIKSDVHHPSDQSVRSIPAYGGMPLRGKPVHPFNPCSVAMQ